MSEDPPGEDWFPSRLSRRLRAGDTILTGWNAIGDPLVGETMARAGYDAVLMDMQHGFHTTDSILRGVGALALAQTPALTRIPVGRFDMASRALDFGSQAVVAPMINNVADARAFAAAMKYPPVGERSWGPTRSLALHGY
ncbi:MAG: aldolase/citrate lyase family protein, partial [Alphaproteobacteria bacterium]